MKVATQQVIGIVGDGQLALMLAESLIKKGLDFCALSTSISSPMMRAFPLQTTLDPDEFQKKCSVFTLENEFLSTTDLKNLLKEKNSNLFPDLASYAHFTDKISQRKLFQRLNINSPLWMELSHPEQLENVTDTFSFPFVLKASQGGYDGKGVRMIRTQEEFVTAVKDFGLNEGRTLLIEEKIKIKKEVAQGFLRHQNGTSTFLPLVDTLQEDGVCNFVFYPAVVSSKVQDQITNILNKLIQHPLVGIFNFEFFVDENETVYINEGAPRPHNSQHLTIDASTFSQFDLLALYLSETTDLPHKIETKPSTMINLLGKTTTQNYELKMPAVIEQVQVHPKLYGKEKCSPGRKMGHVNIVDQLGKSNLQQIARKIFKEYEL